MQDRQNLIANSNPTLKPDQDAIVNTSSDTPTSQQTQRKKRKRCRKSRQTARQASTNPSSDGNAAEVQDAGTLANEVEEDVDESAQIVPGEDAALFAVLADQAIVTSDDEVVAERDGSDGDSDCGNKLVQESAINGEKACTALMENADDLDAVEAGNDAEPFGKAGNDPEPIGEAGNDAEPFGEAVNNPAAAIDNPYDLDGVEAGNVAEPIVEAVNDPAAAVEAGNNPAAAVANAREEVKDENANVPNFSFPPFLQSCMDVVDNAWDTSVEATANVIVDYPSSRLHHLPLLQT
ncbi:hypothetical protein HDU76_009903 [Blyttiomyces sp. JEL0837]|nr:hypothetical protein HDU76_009903 [Blyttiomyces sp. JEL0837]